MLLAYRLAGSLGTCRFKTELLRSPALGASEAASDSQSMVEFIMNILPAVEYHY